MNGRSVRRSSVRAAALVALVVFLSGCRSLSGVDAESRSDRRGASAWPDDVFELSSSADRAYRESRWIDSARHYQQLTQRVPEDAYVWFRLGNTYAQQGDFDRAARAYETSLARNPDQPKPWFNLATAHLLNAQRAMRRSWEAMRPGDPARVMIELRLSSLGHLIHQRIEDGGSGAGTY